MTDGEALTEGAARPGPPDRWAPVRVAAVRRWVDDPALGAAVTLTLDAALPFVPGQFVNLALDRPPPPGGRRPQRSYSLASAPGEPLATYVVRVAGGAVSPGLVDLRPGDTVLLERRAAGRFTLDALAPGGTTLWLVATGAGVGPYVSVLAGDDVWRRFGRVVLVHAVRHPALLAYAEALRARAAAAGGAPLVHVPVVSRAAPPAGGLAGHVQDRLADGALEAAAGAPLDAASRTLLCGNPHMIEAVRRLLEARGLARSRPRAPGAWASEPYWGLGAGPPATT